MLEFLAHGHWQLQVHESFFLLNQPPCDLGDVWHQAGKSAISGRTVTRRFRIPLPSSPTSPRASLTASCISASRREASVSNPQFQIECAKNRTLQNGYRETGCATDDGCRSNRVARTLSTAAVVPVSVNMTISSLGNAVRCQPNPPPGLR